jgi:hypothetical protein
LNKQYTKEEYEALVPKIIQHMKDKPFKDSAGRVYPYGELFPPEFSPFAYNESVAQDQFPLTREEALAQGFSWREPRDQNISITKTARDLPDNIKEVSDSILNEVIECEHRGECNDQCTQAFRLISQELEFYRKMHVPLPRLCPRCRTMARISQRTRLTLSRRRCMCTGAYSENNKYKNTIEHSHGSNPCPNEFETTYTPERPEIVYCETCYQNEVV